MFSKIVILSTAFNDVLDVESIFNPFVCIAFRLDDIESVGLVG